VALEDRIVVNFPPSGRAESEDLATQPRSPCTGDRIHPAPDIRQIVYGDLRNLDIPSDLSLPNGAIDAFFSDLLLHRAGHAGDIVFDEEGIEDRDRE
jgi:hypothetical protein